MTADRKQWWVPALAAVLLSWGTSHAYGAPPAHLVPFPEDAAEQAAQAKPVKPEPPKSDFQPRFRPPSVKQAEHLEPAAKEAGAVVPASAQEPVAKEPGSAEPMAEESQAAAPAELSPAAAPAELSPAAAPAASPQLLPAGEPADPSALAGREALNEAFKLSKVAQGESDYTAIIAHCERGKVGVEKQYQAYADQLMGWAYNRRGEARAKAGDETQALSDFEAAVRLGGAWRAVHNRGVSYAAAGRMKEALADFERTIEINPRYPNAYYNRGELRYRGEDYPGAIDDYSKALALGPPDAATFNSRGHAFYRMQKFGDALRDYGEAIKLDPSNPDPLINRGDTYSDLGQYGQAAADYRAAVQIAPECARAFQSAAWLMATCPDVHYRDEKLAVDAAKRAIELDGPNYRNLSTLAAAEANAGQYEAARATQEKAIAAAPKDQVVTGEKMMALYQREIAFRDRPLTAFSTPEDTAEKEIRQANANELIDRITPKGSRAFFQAPAAQEQSQEGPQPGMQSPAAAPGGRYGSPPRVPRQLPQQGVQQQYQPLPEQGQPQQQQPAPRTRLFGPKGRI